MCSRLFFVLLLMSALCGCDQRTQKIELTGPLTLSFDNEGQFADGSSWTLDMSADGSVNLEIRTFPTPTTQSFTVTEQQMSGLRSLLVDERFFELGEEYGQIVADGSLQTMTVRCGDTEKTIKLHFLMNWVHSAPAKLREPARAIRVWMHVRKWFDDPEAVNLGRYDQMVLNAVAGR